METLAKRVVYIREHLLQLKQREFAKAIGVSRGAVGNWELGGKIRPKHLIAISEHAKVSLDWLMSGQGGTPQPLAAIKDVTEVAVRVMARLSRLPLSDRELILVADIIREFYERQRFAPEALRKAIEQLELDIRKVLPTETLRT